MNLADLIPDLPPWLPHLAAFLVIASIASGVWA